MTDAVKPCPNRECNSKCYVRQTSRYWVQCEECEYSGPTAITKPEAIRLHNLICTPPAGWKLVPVEPTETMLAACRDPRAYNDSRPAMVKLREITDRMREDDYKAMLSVVPENDDER